VYGVIHRPYACLILSLLVFIACVAGAHRLSINADTRAFFSPTNENRQKLDIFEKRFSSGTNLLIVLHAQDGDLFTQDRLSALIDLTDKAWQLPYSQRVESVSSFTHIASDTDGIEITEAIPPALIQSPDLVRDRVMSDSLLVSRLISRDAKTAAINITVDYPMNSSLITGEILDAAKTMVAASSAKTVGFEAWYGGRVASSYAFSQASKNDLKTLIPLNFAIIFCLLCIALRSPASAALLFITAAMAAGSAMGLAGWAGLQINAATAHVPTVIIALGVAALLHLVISVRKNRRAGLNSSEAVKHAIETDRIPIIITLGTTCVGFMTLNAADAPPFRELGRLVGLGALFCLFYGLVFLPACLRLVNISGRASLSIFGNATNAVENFSVSRRKQLVWIIPMLTVVAIAGISKISINDTFPDYFSESFEFRRHADLIEQKFTGLEVIEFDVGSDQENMIFDADYVDKLTRFENWLVDQPKVEHVSSILEIYRRLNQHLNAGAPEMYTIPDDRQALAQYILLYEMSLPLGQELTTNISIDKARSRITVIMRNASTKDVRELRERGEDWLANETPTEITGAGTGLAVMYSYLSSLNVKSMLGGTAAALIIISAILVFAFRNLRLGIISLIPNLFPGAVAFGLWGYAVGEVGVAVSVVGAMTLGIIVDDTVHIIWRYREARRKGADPDVAARMMFDKVGEPMLISTLVLIAGFSVLAVSGFHITSSTGILVATTLGIALVQDWFFLVPLLIIIDNAVKRYRSSKVETTGSDLELVAKTGVDTGSMAQTSEKDHKAAG